MKKKHLKKLAINKLKISAIDFSEKIKGGSIAECPPTYKVSCTKGESCPNRNMGG